jgi:DNA-binding CsgD family transcriptional regulator
MMVLASGLSLLSARLPGAEGGASGTIALLPGWRASPSRYVIASLSSLISYSAFPLVFARLACLSGNGDWRGFRAISYRVYAAASAASLCAIFILMPVLGDRHPGAAATAARAFDAAIAFALKPAFIASVAFAIVDLVARLLDCPWPRVRSLLKRTWPLFLVLSATSLLNVFIPWAGNAFKLILILGGAMSAAESLAFLRESGLNAKVRPEPEAKPDEGAGLEASMSARGFTGREREVCGLLLDGWTYGDIGRFLSISPTTVKTHVQSAYRRTGAANKLELLRTLKDAGR